MKEAVNQGSTILLATLWDCQKELDYKTGGQKSECLPLEGKLSQASVFRSTAKISVTQIHRHEPVLCLHSLTFICLQLHLIGRSHDLFACGQLGVHVFPTDCGNSEGEIEPAWGCWDCTWAFNRTALCTEIEYMCIPALCYLPRIPFMDSVNRCVQYRTAVTFTILSISLYAKTNSLLVHWLGQLQAAQLIYV